MGQAENQESQVITQAGSIEQLRRFASGEYLYALTDGAFCNKVTSDASNEIIALLRPHAVIEPRTLPYLIHVSEPILESILAEAHGTPWGVFVMSKADPEALRLHFRRFLMVELPDGEQWYFRFYDPRLLPIYLSTCNEWELRKFFGPVRGFGIPALADPGVTILRYDPSKGDMSSTDPYSSLVWHIRPEQAQALMQP